MKNNKNNPLLCGEALVEALNQIARSSPFKIVFSKAKRLAFRKVQMDKKGDIYQLSKYSETQVFHENIDLFRLEETCLNLLQDSFNQLHAWSESRKYSLGFSKKGKVLFHVQKILVPSLQLKEEKNGEKLVFQVGESKNTHNRQKNYILPQGHLIPPLVDMGILTKEGKVVASMYDKFKQINRLLEIIDDEVKKMKTTHLNIIDFGCGKSYLTFVLYYYLTQIRNLSVQMIGLDLKEAVIEKCKRAATKYNYENLSFQKGDIKGFSPPFPVDIVISLHACDTATDYALASAVSWKTKVIFAVPCCQHELNRQITPQTLHMFSRYGLVKERFSAMATDAIRGNLLEYSGYNTQLLEFVDLEHTPKNTLIRAVFNENKPDSTKRKALQEVKDVMVEYGFRPTLYQLLVEEDKV